jgi:hypothetical protein
MQQNRNSVGNLGLGVLEATLIVTSPEGDVMTIHVPEIQLGSESDSSFALKEVSTTPQPVSQEFAESLERVLSVSFTGRLSDIGAGFTVAIETAPDPTPEEIATPPLSEEEGIGEVF